MLRKIFIVCLSLLYFWPALNYSQKARLPILPYPKMIQMQEDFFILDTTITLHFGKSDTTHLSIGIGELTEILTDIAGKKYTTNNAASQVIQFGFPERERKLKRLLTNMKIWPEARISDEGYILLIQPKRIFIVANQPPGIYYGIQTLKQLLQNLPASKKLACMTIIDWPDFKYRGIMDDISRGPVPTLDFMKQQIRRFASLKLNMLTYYTENVVRTQKHSDFAPTGGGISIDEWGELAKYADRYHIQLVGNFQSFGHFEKILAYPQYAHLGEAGRMLTPTREESYQFISDIYGEMTPAFTSPFFHVNCDETWDLGRLESRKMVDSLGLAGVYALHLNRLHRILKKLNKKMLCWADIALAHPKVLEAIPRDIILLSWNYRALNSFDEMLEPLHKAGFMTFVCPGVLNSNRIWPDYQVARQNIFNFIRDGKKFMSAGVLTTVWDDGGSALFGKDWFGVAYTADQSWHSDSLSDQTFDQRFDPVIYGGVTETVSKAVLKLARLADLTPTQEMNEKCFWTRMLPEFGEKFQLSLQDWDDVLIICAEADSCLNSLYPTRNKSDLDYLKFTIQQYQFLAQSKFDLLAAADTYKIACMIQKKSPEECRLALLSAIEKLDSLNLVLESLKQQFEHLWLYENRIYWLDRIADKFERHAEDLNQTIFLLKNTLRDFENGANLPPPNQVRLAISEIEGNYFSSWLLCGPFPNPLYSGEIVDYLASVGGELQAHPTVWSEVEWPAGKRTRWWKYTSPVPSIVDLAKIFDENTRVLAYAFCQIESSHEQIVKATFGSNDGIEIIFNGQQLFTTHTKRNLIPDEDQVKLPLKPGVNHLLLKIFQGKGDWGFSFRLPGLKIRNHDHKYRIEVNSMLDGK